VAVYLPPGYAKAQGQRYPVVYLQHGFTDDVDHWWGVKPHFVSVPEVADRALAASGREMILVMPKAFHALSREHVFEFRNDGRLGGLRR
jgi:enterochelin esterase-like enzyme